MLLLAGTRLTIEEVCAVARGANSEVQLAPEARIAMERSRALIERLAAGDDPIYAVNTGGGLLAAGRVSREKLARLQQNVVRSHAAGVGEPLSREVVRGIMLIRANV